MNSFEDLIIKQIEIGPMQNYVYFIGDRATRQVAVVDPAWDVDAIRHEARRNDWQIACILLTHGHPDHMDGVGELQDTQTVPVYLSAAEPEFYTPTCRELRRTTSGQMIKVGGIEITCLATPGHTPGSQCYLCDPVVLTGDTLFISGCGRCDLPGGDVRALYHSLYDTLLALAGHLRVYPGHRYGPAPSMTLEELKKINPYLQCPNESAFISAMGM